MSRLKKPENESTEAAETRQHLEMIANHATRSEKTSWNRKHDNMKELIATLTPIEEEIIRLMVAKQPILDDIQVLRRQMVDSCIHPYDMLTLSNGLAVCKFCNRVLSAPMK